MKKYSIIIGLLNIFALGAGIKQCPGTFGQSGFLNDLGLLSDAVSWGDDEIVQGVCGKYIPIKTCDGVYDTRMRIYSTYDFMNDMNDINDTSINTKKESVYITFRPTQQTYWGGQIHANRELVPCEFLVDGNCTGLVHKKFQEAFLDLMGKCQDVLDVLGLIPKNEHPKIYIGSHSLGGSFSLFMTLYLHYNMGRLPEYSIGLAGPFIGDEEFTNEYQRPLHKALGDKWKQVEVSTPFGVDGTVEGYNVDHAPFIYIEEDALCYLDVESPLPINAEIAQHDSSFAYGLHDLKQYRLGLNGITC